MIKQYNPLVLIVAVSISLFAGLAQASGLMPFVLGSQGNNSSVKDLTASTEKSLTDNGFEIVGKYSPSQDKTVIVVTNEALKSMAGMSKNGGFGAMQRVAITKTASGADVTYTNPTYLWNAYRMKGDITVIQSAMEKALGNQKQFGADEALSASDLREYHYKMMMPYFDDEDELAEHDSYKQAVATVEAGLEANQAGAKKVYRIDIPGKEMTVFGVALSHGEGADKFISDKIDGKSNSHAAHFPYEVLVVGDEVIALNGKFRIAINWPSLSMMGEGSFMSISGAPDDIKAALEAVANNQALDTESDSLI
jgi:hypothetical protein